MTCTNEKFATMLLGLGGVAGSLSLPEVRSSLVEAIRSGSLSIEYVSYVRDLLDGVLKQAAEPEVP